MKKDQTPDLAERVARLEAIAGLRDEVVGRSESDAILTAERSAVRRVVKSLLQLSGSGLPKRPATCKYCGASLWFVPLHRKTTGEVCWAILDDVGRAHSCRNDAERELVADPDGECE